MPAVPRVYYPNEDMWYEPETNTTQYPIFVWFTDNDEVRRFDRPADIPRGRWLRVLKCAEAGSRMYGHTPSVDTKAKE